MFLCGCVVEGSPPTTDRGGIPSGQVRRTGRRPLRLVACSVYRHPGAGALGGGAKSGLGAPAEGGKHGRPDRRLSLAVFAN